MIKYFMEQNECLTESNLGKYLEIIFSKPWIHNKAFIDLKRPDYRNDELKLIVEFDGPRHYTEPSRIVNDKIRDAFYLEHGYETVRIPMFVQLTPATIKTLFGIDCQTVNMTYGHGFIADTKTLVLPASFCELGIIKFKRDLEKFSCIRTDIIESLRTKISKLGDIDLVLPPSLRYLLN